MSLPFWTTNPYTLLTLGNIETEFGGNAPTNFSEYYAGGNSGYVASDRVGYPFGVETPIPAAGVIAISNFYGASSVPYTIVTDKPNYNEGEVITFSITSPDLDGTTMYWTIEDSTANISISPDTLPDAAINAPYQSLLTSTGGTGPYFYTVVYGALPIGIALRANGLITGTPTSIGTTTFIVSSTDSQFNSSVKQYTIEVKQVVINIQPLSVPTAVINVAYAPVTFSVTGGQSPYTLSLIGNLPAGITFNNGAISGTPTQSGNFNFSIKATDANSNFGIKSYNLLVEAVNIAIAPGSIPAASQRIGYSVTLSATGGTAPYTFNLTAGQLPAGLALNSTTGVISGLTSNVGNFLITVLATDANRNSGQQNYTLTVNSTTLVISPATLPNGSRNVAYSQTLTATGGQSPYTWSILSGTLPTGLSLVGNQITGTPTVIGNSSFVIKVVDANGNSAQINYTIAISAVSIVIDPASLTSATQGQVYSQQLSASGGAAPYVFSVVDTLPAGITLSQSGLLSGTPTTAGNPNFTVQALDSNQNTGTKNYTLPVISTVWTITAAGYGAAPIFVNEGVQLTFNITAPITVTDGAITAYLIIGAPNTTNSSDVYLASTAVSMNNRSGTVNVRINADYITEGAEYFNVWVEYPQGSQTVVYGQVNVNDTSVSPISGCGGDLVLSSVDPLPALAYQPFSFTLSATGGTAPYTFSQGTGTLPTGLTFYSANATVAGTPTVTVTNRAVVFRATDATGLTGYCTYNFTFNAPTITISPSSIPEGIVGQASSTTFTASGGTPPYTFTRTSGSFAAGFNLVGSVLSGIPTTIDSATFILTARDANNFTGTATYTQTFNTTELVLSPASLPDAWVSTAYSQQVSVTAGGAAPYTFSITSGSLPPGLSISNAGLISGVPTQTGSYSFTVVATDRYGKTGTISYSVIVNTLTITDTTFNNATAGFQYTKTINATGGQAPYSFSLLYGNMPGWNITQTSPTSAIVGGTTTGKGNYSFTIKVTDSAGRNTLLSPTVYVFPLVKPNWNQNYNIRNFPNINIPSTPIPFDNTEFVYLVFKRDGTWEIRYIDKGLNTLVAASGVWYDGPIDQNVDGKQLSFVAQPSGAIQPVKNLATLPEETAWAALLTHTKNRLVVPPTGPSYWEADFVSETQSASVRIFWTNRQNATEEYIVRLSFSV